MSQSVTARILAIDLRSSTIGFAVFEMPILLLDWGNRDLIADLCSTFIMSLLRRYEVSFMVVRGIKVGGRRDTPRARNGLRLIREVARRHGVEVVTIGDRRFTTFFRCYNRQTKYEIASFMTAVFPELSRALPSKRKCFQPENRRMSAFDAVALAVVFIAASAEDDAFDDLLNIAGGVLSPASR
jgi:hypothetical protein